MSAGMSPSGGSVRRAQVEDTGGEKEPADSGGSQIGWLDETISALLIPVGNFGAVAVDRAGRINYNEEKI